MSIEQPFMMGGNKMATLNAILKNLEGHGKPDTNKNVIVVESKLHPKVKRIVVPESKRPNYSDRPQRLAVYDPDALAQPRQAQTDRAQRVNINKSNDGAVIEHILSAPVKMKTPSKPLYSAPVIKAVAKTLASLDVPANVIRHATAPVPMLPALSVMEIEEPLATNPDLSQRTAELRSIISEFTMEPIGETLEAESAPAPSGSVDIVDALAKKPVAPFVCRVGNKEDIAKWIARHMPPQALKVYVEPFIGGGSVYLVKERAPSEAINDFNGAIVKQWKTLKSTTTSEMLKQWESDRVTRAFIKGKLNFFGDMDPKKINLKKYIEERLASKTPSAIKSKFGEGKAYKNWASKLNGNSLRYEAQSTVRPSAKSNKSLQFKDLTTNSVKEFPVEEATMLYEIQLAFDDLLNNGRAERVDIAKYKGGAKKGTEVAESYSKIVKDLEAETLPEVTMLEWLRDRFDIKPNDDEYASESEKMVLVGKTTLVDLIYEKLRTCGGFGGSGAVPSDAVIKLVKTGGLSPFFKLAIREAIQFLLVTGGGLHEFNQRLKNTEITKGDYYQLVKKYDSPNTFFMCDPPYQSSGGYGNSQAFNFEAFVKSVNGIPDPGAGLGHDDNPAIKGKILVTINGGDKLLAWFRKYARISKIPWYGLKVYVRQKSGKSSEGTKYRYEIFYGTYMFHEKAVNILDKSFRNMGYGKSIEGDVSQREPASDEGAIYINSEGGDESWSAFSARTGAVSDFANRDKEDNPDKPDKPESFADLKKRATALGIKGLTKFKATDREKLLELIAEKQPTGGNAGADERQRRLEWALSHGVDLSMPESGAQQGDVIVKDVAKRSALKGSVADINKYNKRRDAIMASSGKLIPSYDEYLKAKNASDKSRSRVNVSGLQRDTLAQKRRGEISKAMSQYYAENPQDPLEQTVTTRISESGKPMSRQETVTQREANRRVNASKSGFDKFLEGIGSVASSGLNLASSVVPALKPANAVFGAVRGALGGSSNPYESGSW